MGYLRIREKCMSKVTRQRVAIMERCKCLPVHGCPGSPPKGGQLYRLATPGVPKGLGTRQWPCLVAFVSGATRGGVEASQVGSAALGGWLWFGSFALPFHFRKAGFDMKPEFSRDGFPPYTVAAVFGDPAATYFTVLRKGFARVASMERHTVAGVVFPFPGAVDKRPIIDGGEIYKAFAIDERPTVAKANDTRDARRLRVFHALQQVGSQVSAIVCKG